MHLLLAILSSASAATPTWAAHAQGSAGRDAVTAEQLVGVGGALGLELEPLPRMQPELALDLGLGGAPNLDARLALRAFLTDAQDPTLRLSASAEYGLRVQGGLAPRGALGLALDTPVIGPVRPRVGVRYHLGGIETSAMQLTLGVVRAPPPEPIVEPEPEPVVEAPPPLPEVLRVAPPGSVIWVPHPLCQWVPVEEAQDLLSKLPEGSVVRVIAPDGSTELVTLGPERPIDVDLPERAPQGALVVAAYPDDQVRVGDLGVGLADDGVAVLTTPPGLVSLDLVGGGREQSLDLALADGMVVWVRPDPPPPTRIRFVVGRAELTPEAKATLTELVETRGSWGLNVQGSFSPEGDQVANVTLAQARADAVVAYLREQGLPEAELRVEAPTPAPDPTLSLADQRACLITPLRPEEAP